MTKEFSTEEKIAFIASLYCPARVVSDETGCSWRLMLAQVAQECGWGEKVLPGTNNIFNIKADKSWKGESKIFNVKEFDSHKHPFMMKSPFRIYPTILDSLRDRAKFLKENPRYHRLFDDDVKGNIDAEAYCLQAAKYALDPEYADALVKVARGPTMRKSVARAQAAGCAAALPVIEIFMKDGAKAPLILERVQVSHDGRSAEATTDAIGSLAIRLTPSSKGVINIKLYDDVKRVWIDVSPIPIPNPVVSTTVTLIAPTFTVHADTVKHHKPPREREKESGTTAPPAPGASGSVAPSPPTSPAPAPVPVLAPVPAPAAAPAPVAAPAPIMAKPVPPVAAPPASTAAPKPVAAVAAKPAGAVAAVPGAAPHTAAQKTYKIKKGDTLTEIAKLFRMRYKTIADFNKIKSPYIIRPGQILRIPDLVHSGHKATPGAAATAITHPPAAKPAPAPAVPHPPSPNGAATYPPVTAPTSAAAAPAVKAPYEFWTAPVVPDFLTALHTLYYRDEADKPKTEIMVAARAPWMKFAEEEFKAHVKRVVGPGTNQHILDYFKNTSLFNHHAAPNDEIAWCAAFCNWCLVKGGYAGNDDTWAAAFKHWGRPTKDNQPALGAVAVIKFNDGSHHVTFAAGFSSDGNSLHTLGGNQGGAHGVTHSHVPKNLVVCYRYPLSYPDNPEDYILHPVQSDGTVITAGSTN